MKLNRREFVQYVSALGISAAVAEAFFDRSAWAQRTAPSVPTNTGISGKVVVVGGGMGGATAAKFLRLWGGDKVEVSLVERDASYTSNIMSNLVLNGQKTIAGLQYNYSTLASRYGVKVVKGEVVGIDPAAKMVSLAGGSRLPYDRLVLAPGVEFDLIPGIESEANQALFPHAWKAGAQTNVLRNQLLAMPAGGTFIMTIPLAPYRCPPGPYERACVVADWLKTNKPGSKVIVLDANPGITAEPVGFNRAFTQTHKGVIEYIPSAAISSIDPSTKTVLTTAGNFKGNVINPIPPHRAGKIAQTAGLVSVAGRWAGVDVLSYESLVVPNIHVIGDAIGTTQPKSGHIANAEAKVCADAITKLLVGKQPDPSPVTNSACYSPITATTASWLTAVFQYDPASKTMKVRSIAEAEAATSNNYSQMGKWFAGLMRDSFA